MAGMPAMKLLAQQDSLRGMDWDTREHFIKTKMKMLDFLGIRGHHEVPMKHLAPPPMHPMLPVPVAQPKHPRTPRVHRPKTPINPRTPSVHRPKTPLHPRTPQLDGKRKHVAPVPIHKNLHHLGLATPKPARKPEAAAKPRRKT